MNLYLAFILASISGISCALQTEGGSAPYIYVCNPPNPACLLYKPFNDTRT